MPQMNFDLEDGQDPVSFVLSKADADRFISFMADCTDAIKRRDELTEECDQLRRNRDMYQGQVERQASQLLDQRYRLQRVCKASSDLVELVEWHAYRGAESRRRLNVVKHTLREFGPGGEPS